MNRKLKGIFNLLSKFNFSIIVIKLDPKLKSWVCQVNLDQSKIMLF